MKPTIMIVVFVLLCSACRTQTQGDDLGATSADPNAATCQCEDNSCFCMELGAVLTEAEEGETESMTLQELDELFAAHDQAQPPHNAPHNDEDTQHEGQ